MLFSYGPIDELNINRLKVKVLELCFKSREGHIGSSFSIMHLLYVLYREYLQSNEAVQKNEFVLSKGHASIGFYCILFFFRLISKKELESFCAFDSSLGGHPSRIKLPKVVNASTGSLGHGLPFAVGMAYAKKVRREEGRVFVLIGDGECNEGTIWESALLISKLRLTNMVIIVDHNLSGERAIPLGDLADKFESFGFLVQTVDGHNLSGISSVLSDLPSDTSSVLVANTVKGQGILEMENNPEWHHKWPDIDQLEKFTRELLKT